MRKDARDAIAGVDSLAFDCDGVLVDTRRSYDAAIMATLDRVFRRMFNLVLRWKKLSPPLIQGLRNTGRFNNDWDIVYAVSLFTACCLPNGRTRDFARNGADGQPRFERLSEVESTEVFSKALRMVVNLSRSLTSSSNKSAEELVWDSLPEDKRELSARVKEFLGYPGNPPSSLLASLFDEVYHGGALFREMYGLEPRYHRGLGFIEHDRVIIRAADLAWLSDASDGRLAIATGRPRKAAEYSLGKLMSYFKLNASVFIGDGDIRPTPEAASFRKPSGKSLLWAQKKLHSRKLLYVGDSVEDVQMVRNARKSTDGLAFTGIYASSYEPAAQLRFFKQQRAELILPSVRAMTRVMKEVSDR